jgi:RimJ/RimL family protein N-acetyltransferase
MDPKIHLDLIVPDFKQTMVRSVDCWRFAEQLKDPTTCPHVFKGSIPITQNDLMEEFIEEKKKGSIIWFIQDGGITIGYCGLFSYKPVFGSWEYRIFILDKTWQGKGIGTEVTKRVVHHAFHRLNAHRIWLDVNGENAPALRVYERAGFNHEGTFRDALWLNGEYHDMVRYAILEPKRK